MVYDPCSSFRLDAMTSQVDYLHEQDKSHRLALIKLEQLFASDITNSDTSLNTAMDGTGPLPSPRRSISEVEATIRNREPVTVKVLPPFANGLAAHLSNKRPASPSWTKEGFNKTPKLPRVRMLSEHAMVHGDHVEMRSRSGSDPTVPFWKVQGASPKESPTRKVGRFRTDSLTGV